MAIKRAKSTDDILLILCNSVQRVLSNVTKSRIEFSPMVQKINKTCLKPDIGTFVLFDGGFSGLVIINFSAVAAVEIYQEYMLTMGMPKSELASHHTADEVGDILGELMNQIVGDFRAELAEAMLISVNKSQPKMLAINKEIMLSISTNIERPKARKVAFKTADRNIFYLEMAMEKTEFIEMHDFEREAKQNPDEIIQGASTQHAQQESDSGGQTDEDLLAELGL